MRRAILAALVGAAVVTACASPEASRQRGQAGADPGNRGAVLDMHGTTDPAHDTPEVGKAIQTK